jgi:hypothetical protein
MSILGVRFDLKTADQKMLCYAHTFVDAYDTSDDFYTDASSISVIINRGTLPEDIDGQTIPVHRTKHAYWNFDGQLLPGDEHYVIWPTKGISIKLNRSVDEVFIEVDKRIDPIFAGESIFHVCRGLALYKRPGYMGNLLHASSILFNEGAIVFCGPTSSGKTTLMTEAVFACNARPLANDRVLVTATAPPSVISWPSYASFCEGTLLKYPPLARAAMEYERDTCYYRTQSWPWSLRQCFTKDSKRIYPMVWFSSVVGKKYVRQSPLHALVIAKVHPLIEQPGVELYDLADISQRHNLGSLLSELVFDREEESFMPWHGLSMPTGIPTLESLLNRMHSANIPVFRLQANPNDLTPLYHLLEELKR